MELRRTFLLILLLAGGHMLLAQKSVQGIVEAYEKYETEWPSQKIYVAFNQEKYAPGDTVFFKAYLLSADLGLWSGSQMMEINLLDKDGEVRQKATIKTQDGMGSNQLILPEDLEAGLYNFTAFTNWMRNFDASVMFEQNLMVVKDFQIETAASKPLYGIEGGNLTNGLLSNIVVKSMTPESLVYLKDQNGERIDSVMTDALGLGVLKAVADKANNYFLEEGDAVVFMPTVQDFGYNLSVTLPRSSTEDVRILVSAQPAPNASELSFIITSKGKVVYHEAIPGNQARVGKSIGQDRLSPGLYQVSLLSSEGEVLGYREFYLKDDNSADLKLNVSSESVAPRMSVDMNIEALGQTGGGDQLSVSVINADVQNFSSLGLAEKITLADRVSSLSHIHETEGLSSLIDQYLILKSKPIDWTKIINYDGSKPTYGYSTLFQMTGIAKDSTGANLPDNSTLMFYLQNDLMRYEVNIIQGGYFQLNLLDIYGEDELFIIAEKPSGEEVLDIDIEWIHLPLPEFKKAPEFKLLDVEDTYAQFNGKRRKVDHSFEFFSSKANLDSLADLNRSRAPKVPILEGDNSFNVEDFYLFPTFGEFLNEVVRPLRVGQQKGKPLVRVRFLEPDIATGDPLYIIDGIATKNTEFFLSLDPKSLKTISVIKYPKKLSRFGQMAKNGIVIVDTKTGNVREPLNENRLIYGLNSPMDFPELNAEWANESGNPEFRSTVYWNPLVELNEAGKASVQFINSDDIATLAIRIEGFVGGRPVSLMKKIEPSQVGQY
ncbi:MAG: hypothetical protein HWE21_09140 [Cytophagia bacterium]|nr:hypothetical protein [Cytophagia bacterium]